MFQNRESFGRVWQTRLGEHNPARMAAISLGEGLRGDDGITGL